MVSTGMEGCIKELKKNYCTSVDHVATIDVQTGELKGNLKIKRLARANDSTPSTATFTKSFNYSPEIKGKDIEKSVSSLASIQERHPPRNGTRGLMGDHLEQSTPHPSFATGFMQRETSRIFHPSRFMTAKQGTRCDNHHPHTKKTDTILVIADQLSKYSHFLPFSHPYTTKEVVELFYREIVKFHGYSCSIISNRDHLFMS